MQGLRPTRLVAVRIEADPVMLFRLQPQRLGGNMLQGAQQLAVMLQQQIGVRAFALDIDVAPLQPVRIHGTRARRDAKPKPKSSNRGYKPHQCGNRFGCQRKILHLRILRGITLCSKRKVNR